MGLIKATFLTHPGNTRRQPAPNDNFGGTVITLCALSSLLPQLHGHPANPVWLMAAAAGFLLLLWYPQVYTPFNLAWKNLSLALSYIFITLLWVFYILPSGFFMQARGKDPLRLRFQPQAQTYWQAPTPRTNMQRPL